MDLHNDHAVREWEEERNFRTCCGTRSHMRCASEACQRSRRDTSVDRELHEAEHEHQLRARSHGHGRRRYFGVGPGVELPTRMHYFEGALNHGNVGNATPRRGLRRIPVVNFELLRAGRTLVDGYPPAMCTSELEEHLFDAPLRIRTECAAHKLSHYDECGAVGGSEARLAKAAACSYNPIVSELVPVGLQLGPSVGQSLHQGQTCLLNNSVGEFQV